MNLKKIIICIFILNFCVFYNSSLICNALNANAVLIDYDNYENSISDINSSCLLNTQSFAYHGSDIDSLLNNFTITVKGNQITITGLTDNAINNQTSNIIIPSYVSITNENNDTDFYFITQIAKDAFNNNNNITTITIPEYCSIEEKAFFNCSNLTTINFAKTEPSLEINKQKVYNLYNTQIINTIKIKIGISAFENCNNLNNIDIPNTFTSIEDRAFKGCTNLNNITIGDNINFIGNNVFPDCALQTQQVANSEYKYCILGNWLFKCEPISDNITETVCYIPSNVRYIYNNAFDTASNITKIIINDEITYIAPNALNNTQWYDNWNANTINECTLQYTKNGLIYKYLYAYKNANSNITLDSQIYAIGCNVFNNNKNLITINAADCINLKYINDGAFFNSSILTLRLPSTYTENLKIANKAFEKSSLLNINFTSNIEYIGDYAFNETNITQVYIPKNIKYIGKYAFSNCDNITTVMIDELEEYTQSWIYLDVTCFNENDFPHITRLMKKNIYDIEIPVAYADINVSQINFKKFDLSNSIEFISEEPIERLKIQLISVLRDVKALKNIISEQIKTEIIPDILHNADESNFNDVEKLALTYNWISKKVKDGSFLLYNNDTCLQHTHIGALLTYMAVCGGYRNISALILENFNIPVAYLSNGSHAWNLVYIEGEENNNIYNHWYHFDVASHNARFLNGENEKYIDKGSWYLVRVPYNTTPIIYPQDYLNPIIYPNNKDDVDINPNFDFRKDKNGNDILNKIYLTDVPENLSFPTYRLNIPTEIYNNISKNISIVKYVNNVEIPLLTEDDIIKSNNMCYFKQFPATENNYYLKIGDDFKIKLPKYNEMNENNNYTLDNFINLNNQTTICMTSTRKSHSEYDSGDSESYSIDFSSCFTYTINSQTNNNINYKYTIFSSNGSIPIQKSIIKDDITTIYVKSEKSIDNYYIQVKDINENEIFRQPLNEINSYYKKIKINNNVYSTPFELIVTPNNSGAVLNLSDYLDGDVTLDNEVTSYDALTVLMYVVNNYSIIQTGSTGDFNMGHGNITVNGDISSNSAINIHASNGNFNGKITAPLIQTWGPVNAQRETDLQYHVPENPFSDSQMTELFFKDITHIDSDYNNDSYAAENNGETTNININQPVSANSVTLTNNVNINNNLKANGDINISGSVQNDTRCVIYSSDGSITLNSDNFSFTGLIYAPNGTVSITGNNINITGTIIAKEVIIEGDTVNFNTNNNFLNYTNINNEYFDLIGAYLSDLQIFIADIDDDCEVTMSDAECILNKVTGNI